MGKAVAVEVLHVGDYLHVIDKEIGVDKEVRIIDLQRDLLRPHSYEVTLSDTVTKTTTVRVINDIQTIQDVIGFNSGFADPTKARRRWMATQELLNLVFDPEGDYYSDKIKPLSIETQMLSVGAKSTQFTLQNVTIQPNYNGDPNTVVFSGGLLAHYGIDQDKIHTWPLIPSTFGALNPNQAYYIYAVCPRQGGSGHFQLSTQTYTCEQAAGVYYFLVGVLNSVNNDGHGGNLARLISLTYGSSTINGRFVRCGRIESSGGGATYFDLDTGVISGVIRFRTPSGTYKDVADLYKDYEDLETFINTTLRTELDGIQGQLDGVIGQWFYDVDPSPLSTAPSATPNAPTSEWVDADMAAGNDNEKEKHLGDLYYNTATGKVWRYVYARVVPRPGAMPGFKYVWVELADTELAQALALAQEAIAAADDKARIFYTTPYAPYDEGDLWVQGTTGDILVAIKSREANATPSFKADEWKKASKYTDDTGLHDFILNQYTPDVANILNQIDGKIECFYQASDPATNWPAADRPRHEGDQWYNTNTKKLYRYVVAKWQQVNTGTSAGVVIAKPGIISDGDKSMGVVEDATNLRTTYWLRIEDAAAIAAAQAAANAQDTADGKRTVFVKQPTAPYYVGDLWLKGVDATGKAAGGLWRCITKNEVKGTFNQAHWVEATYYDNTETTIDGGIVTAGTIQLANGNSKSIVAGITGGENEAASETEARKVRIWAGASKANRFTAPFRVLQDGSFVATKGTITGTINANAGSIGGFEIGSGRIGTTSQATSSSGKGLSLYNEFIKFSDDNAWVILGTNVLPSSMGGLRALARFENNQTGTYGNNYGLIVNVTEPTYGRAFAMNAKGAIVTSSYVADYGLTNLTPSQNTTFIPGDATKPNPFQILAHFKNANAGLGFPTRDAVCEYLNIAKGSQFAVRFTVVAASDSTQTGWLRGRNSDVSGMNTTQYPYRLNNNAGIETGKLNMAKGDIAEYLLVYDGTNYYAYLLNARS